MPGAQIGFVKIIWFLISYDLDEGQRASVHGSFKYVFAQQRRCYCLLKTSLCQLKYSSSKRSSKYLQDIFIQASPETCVLMLSGFPAQSPGQLAVF